MNFTIEELIKTTNAQVISGQKELFQDKLFSLSTDTRQITLSDFYLPIRGKNFDGHDFIDIAISKGIKGIFTEKDLEINDNNILVLKVCNTLFSYLELALFHKNKVSPLTVAVTGSSGKTTTKEMLYSVIKQKYKTHKTQLNYNNEIGLAQTLLSMPNDTDVLIVEMGMRGLGEIELLSKYSKPDISIITNIGCAHLGRLGSRENIAKAKCEITKYQKENGCLICENSSFIEQYCNFKGQKHLIDIQKLKKENILNILINNINTTSFLYKNNKYQLNVTGEYNILNAIYVIETALELGIEVSKIQQGLLEYKPIEKRWENIEVSGFNIINDCYNANPESMKCALKTFLTLYNSPKILVLGDMLELGENEKKYHEEIGTFLNSYEFDLLITIGNLAKNIGLKCHKKSINFPDNNNIAEYIKNNLNPKSNILVKGSRSLKLEKIIEDLK